MTRSRLTNTYIYSRFFLFALYDCYFKCVLAILKPRRDSGGWVCYVHSGTAGGAIRNRGSQRAIKSTTETSVREKIAPSPPTHSNPENIINLVNHSNCKLPLGI